MNPKNNPLSLLSLINETQMIQITKDNHSIRIRPNNRLIGQFFCTIRKSKVMEDISMVTLRYDYDVLQCIDEFLKGNYNLEEVMNRGRI